LFYSETLEQRKLNIDIAIQNSKPDWAFFAGYRSNTSAFNRWGNLLRYKTLITHKVKYAEEPDMKSVLTKVHEEYSRSIYDSGWLNFLGIGYNWDDYVGSKRYELKDHLGNVVVVISDRRIQHSSDGVTVDYYLPDIIWAADSYAYGSNMPGRTYNPGNGQPYKYGFNGQEKSFEIDAAGNINTAEFWEYDTRTGRRWNLDPMVKASTSGYSVLGNNPIVNTDPTGLDWVHIGNKHKFDKRVHNNKDARRFYGKGAVDETPNGKNKIYNSSKGEVELRANGDWGYTYSEMKDPSHYLPRAQTTQGLVDGINTMMPLLNTAEATATITTMVIMPSAEVAEGSSLLSRFTARLFGNSKKLESVAEITTETIAENQSKYEGLVQKAKELYPNKAHLEELHHIAPKYLGGAADGALAPLNGAYHQVITNEFRSLWSYGLGPVSEQRMLEIMKQVYSKYPLPQGYTF
jgi:hypothetical protein